MNWNWYRFKVELTAWITTTALCVITALTLITMADRDPERGVWSRNYPLSLRTVAENEHLVPYVLVFFVAVMWVCRWKALQIIRADRRYGER